MMKVKYFKRYANMRAELKAIKKVLKSGWLTTGKKVKEFEEKFAEKAGYKYAIAVNSATSGLLLALQTSGIPKGSTIITTPFTFAATAHAIEQSGYNLKFVDTLYERWDPSFFKEVILKDKSSHYIGVLNVDLAGYSNAAYFDWVKFYSHIKLIHDSAHCVPGNKNDSYDNLNTRVFSFYANKNMSCGEGGMVCTNDENQMTQIRTLMNHGIDRDSYSRFTGNTSEKWEYDVVVSGYKFNMSDIQASIGLEQLKIVDEIIKKRYQVIKWYQQFIEKCVLRFYPEDKKPDYYNFKISSELMYYKNNENYNHDMHLLLIKVPESKRDYIIDELSKAGIETSVHYKPLHMMTYFKNKYGFKDEDFPNAYKNYKQTISLPIYPDLKKSEVKYICKILNNLL